MRKKKNQNIHFNRLLPSSHDTVALATAVEIRFVELCDLYLRTKGEKLFPPEHLKYDMIRWRQLRMRHTQGDFRNTEAEVLATRAVAQWTLDIKTDICGREPVTLDWGGR